MNVDVYWPVPAGYSWDRPDWFTLRACSPSTAHLFFEPAGERPEQRALRHVQAARVCAACPVAVECREYARAGREHGFWGGESEEERIAAGFAPPLSHSNRLAKLAARTRPAP